MKRLLLLLLLVSCCARSWGQAPVAAWPTPAGPAVTVEVSRGHGLVRFVGTLAGAKGGYPGTRQVFEKSRFNTLAARRWLARYRRLDREPTIPQEGYPADRLAALASTAPAYLAATADARSLTDLQRRTVGLLPNEALLSLDSVYRYFEPAFDTLAWQPHAAGLSRQRAAFAEFLARGNLMGRFGRLRTFYGSVWPDALPYWVLLDSQLDEGAGLTNKATAVGNLVLLNCHPASRDFVAGSAIVFVSGSAIVFHEMSHTLSVQQRVERWYLKSASPNRRAAYHLMEEALATAGGEWIYAQQTGQPEAGVWYHDDYINRYAQALYPLVQRYVEQGQTIDSLFVNQAVGTFDRTFPQAATDYVNLFRKVLYWTDAEDFQAAVVPFQDRFNSTLTGTATPILGDAENLAAARSGEYLPVILVTRQHAAARGSTRPRCATCASTCPRCAARAYAPSKASCSA